MSNTTMTLQRAAQSALDVQSACNLSGVIYSFAEIIAFLRTLPECRGTKWTNKHPICRLFAEQIMHLTDAGQSGDYDADDIASYSKAYDACIKLAEVPDDTPM